MTHRKADEWLTRKMNKRLTAFYLSPSRDKDAVVVRNIPETATRETIEDCIEVICKDVKFDDIYFHDRSKGRELKNVAMLLLTEKVRDIKAIQQRAEKKKLEKRELEFSVLNPPDGIIMYDVSIDTTKSDLEYYFDKPKLIGEENEVTEVKVHVQVQIAVVLFKNSSEALLKLLQTPQSFKGKTIPMEPYYEKFHDVVIETLLNEGPVQTYEPLLNKKSETLRYEELTCLGKPLQVKSNDETYEYQMFEQKTVNTVHLEQKGFENVGYIVGSRAKSEGKFKGNNSRIRFLTSDFDDEDDDGYLITNGLDSLDASRDTSEKKQFSSSSRSEHIYMEISDNDDVPQIPVTPRPSERRKMGGHSEKVGMEREKIILLRIHRFSKECETYDVGLNSNENSVILTGEKSNIQTAKLRMYEILDQAESVTRRIPKGQAIVLKSCSGKLSNVLRKEKIRAVYSVQGEDTLACQAFSKNEAEKATDVLLKKFEHIEVKYAESNFKFLNSAEWKKLEKKMKEENNVEIEVVRENKIISVDGLCRECQAAAGEIRRSLNKNADASKDKIEIKGSKSVCFFHGFKDDLDKQRSELRKRNGELTYKRDGSKSVTIEITGDRAIVEDTKTAIRHWEEKIWEGPVDLDRISKKDTDLSIMSRALDSGRGKKFLREFEEKNKCGVKVEKKNDKEFPTVRSFPSLHGYQDKSELKRRNTEPNFGGARPKEFPARDNNRWVFDRTEILLIKGNIVYEGASVLVHVKAEKCKLTTGRISKDFMKQGGPEFESNFMRACEGKDVKGVYFGNKSGGLKCAQICHIVLPIYNRDRTNPDERVEGGDDVYLEILTRYVRDCFKKCSLMDAVCVAMPAIGTGQILKYPNELVVDCLVSEAKEAARKTKSIKKIKFVIYDEGTLEEFRRKLQGSSPSSRQNIPSRNDNHDSDDEKNEKTRSTVSLELFAVSKAEGEKLRKALTKDIKDTFLFEETCTPSNMKNLHKDTWKKMTTIANKNHVWLEQDGSVLRLKGEKDAVMKSKGDVLEILLKDYHTSGEPTKNRRSEKYSTQWWMEKSVESTVVPMYWKHFRKGEGLFDKVKDTGKKLFGNGYLVDVHSETLKQIEYLVQSTWERGKVGQGSDAKNLCHQAIRITKVQRIENFDLFDKYQTSKKGFYRRLADRRRYPRLENIKTTKAVKGPVLTEKISRALTVDLDLFSYANELYFFHGTPEKYVDNIINKGLDEKHGGDNAMFGQGIYGAESSTKADQYADDDKMNRQKRDRKMLLMRLLLGDIYVASKPNRFKMPPCANCFKENCTDGHHHPFDSVVADGPWLFREFVVYRREQCYPEYIITYDRI